MADENDETEHTEDPTQKRLDEAIKRGDVVKSHRGQYLVHDRRRRDDADGVCAARWRKRWKRHSAGCLPIRIKFPPTGRRSPISPNCRNQGLAALGIPFLLLTLAALPAT